MSPTFSLDTFSPENSSAFRKAHREMKYTGYNDNSNPASIKTTISELL